MTKNITLSVDEDLLKRVRAVAQERHTSVNALVREHLEHLTKSKDDERRKYREALAELREMSRRSEARLGPDYTFDREEIYAERLR